MRKLSKGYIVSIVSAVLLLLEVVGVKVDVPYVNEVLIAVLGVLVALGVVSGTSTTIKNKTNNDIDTNDAKIDNICDNASDCVDEKTSDVDAVLDDKLDAIESEVDSIVDNITDAIDDITNGLSK